MEAIAASKARSKAEHIMPNKRMALVTGANQGGGFQVAKELVTNGGLVASLQFLENEHREAGWKSYLTQNVGPTGIAWC